MSRQTLPLTEELYQYLLATSLCEDPILQELREYTALLPGGTMQIAPEQGQFMALLVRLLKAKRTLDIGTFTGYSALVIAQALPEDGQVISLDCDEKVTKIAQQFWQKAGVLTMIDLKLGLANDNLDKLIANGEQSTFDFAFIDADKNNYDSYYEKALTLVRAGGLIAIDNVLWSGKVVDANCSDKQTKAIRELNAKLHNDPRVFISLLPLADGLTLAMKK